MTRAQSIILATLVALLAGALVYECRVAQASAPSQLIHARISVPPDPDPPQLLMAVGFEGLANPAEGVYYVSLAVGLAYGPTSAVVCSGTKPGVSCAVEMLPPQDPDTDPYVMIAVYRDRYGVPEDGDLWLMGTL